ncbi:MAG TPA: hypothetical protein PKC43_04990 [Phycisphaerales bacterium]|nr:hypothetical protein [Phycisphaerales bacterium]HMP36785.1 hypothetical protein [Phycisphaerales bacterium]
MVALRGIRAGLALDAAGARALREAMLFEAGKWDPQHAEGSALAPYAILLDPALWRELATLAEGMAKELLAAERALAGHPERWKDLGLPRSFIRGATAALRAGGLPAEGPRTIRFDLHPTTAGWRLSEANTDVPGGFLEAAWLPRILLRLHGRPEACPCGDPGGALALALAERLLPSAGARSGDAGGSLKAPSGARPRDGRTAASASDRGAAPVVALLHATAFVDDRQVMEHLARALSAEGLRPVLAAPDQIVPARDDSLALRTSWYEGAIDGVVRFYPGEWLGLLRHGSGWPALARAHLPQSNPPSSLLVQSKRLALLAERGEVPPMPTFLAALPETCDLRAVIEAEWFRGRCRRQFQRRPWGRLWDWIDRCVPRARRRSGDTSDAEVGGHGRGGADGRASARAEGLVRARAAPGAARQPDAEAGALEPRFLGEEWVLKPALGRVGDGVLVAGAVGQRERLEVLAEARAAPGDFVAQRRFHSISLMTPEGERHFCLGLFTVDGRAVGAYGRVAARARIDGNAQDVAVLVDDGSTLDRVRLEPPE